MRLDSIDLQGVLKHIDKQSIKNGVTNFFFLGNWCWDILLCCILCLYFKFLFHSSVFLLNYFFSQPNTSQYIDYSSFIIFIFFILSFALFWPLLFNPSYQHHHNYNREVSHVSTLSNQMRLSECSWSHGKRSGRNWSVLVFILEE